MKITLKQLRIFCSIYRLGSTTLASEELALSQSAVSNALNTLEQSLNHPLFERDGKKLVRNAAAKKLYPQAHSILKQVYDIEDNFTKGVSKLIIGASTTIGNYLLPQQISAFTQQYPQIEIELHVHNTKEICEGVKHFDYDWGFIEDENQLEELVAEKWLEDELTLFAATQSRWLNQDIHDLTLAQLNQLPLVLREKGSGTRETVEHLILSHLSQPTVLQLSHSEAIRQAVIHDFGIGCLSKLVLNDAFRLEKIRYLSLQGKTLTRQLWQIHHRNKHISAELDLFIQYCQKVR
ncbi:LysR family transcriptional regulator [[Pasteurella] aerogenes]